MPLFGDTEPPKCHEFQVVVWGTPTPGNPNGRAVETYRAWDVDAAGLLMFYRAKGNSQMLEAGVFLLEKALRNDDGLSATYEDDRATRIRKAAEALAVAEGGTDARPSSKHWREAEEQDGPVDPRADNPEEWSSRRRFAAMLDDPNRRIQLDALTKACRWLIEESAARPTSRPES